MPEMTPVGNTIIPPNPMTGINTISGIMGIQQQKLQLQRQAQQIQTGQALQQTAQAEAQQSQQAMGERQQLQSVLKTGIRPDTGESIYNDQNEVDPDKLTDYATKNLALTGQAVAQNILKTKSDKTALASATADLGDKYNADISGRIRSFVNDPNATSDMVNNSLKSYVDQNPNAANAVLKAGEFIKHLDGAQGQKEKNAQLIQLAQMFQPHGETATQQQPNIATYQGAKGVQPFQSNPYAPGGIQNAGPPLGPQGITPQVVTMPNKTLQIWGPNGGGGGAGNGNAATSPANPTRPRTAMDDAPPANAPGPVQEAYGQAVGEANKHVETIRQADNPLDYGNNMQIANQIRKLSQNADTGPGTDTWHHVLGALGAPVGANNVADYQLLGAYLDRQAAGVRGAMGLPATNEGGVQSREIAGNVTYQKKALQDKNDLTQSLVEGLHQYRNGLDRIAGFSGQASPTAVNQFKNAWTQNFDPNVYKGELAYKRSKAEGDAFVKTLDPQEAASLAAKRKALQALSQGKLPQ